MDSAINTAARALAAGDPLAALDRVALRDDPPALALRGVAMAQLGELARARALLAAAARKFGRREPLAWARCVVAQLEIAVAQRELTVSAGPLQEALAVLDAHGDVVNATHARLVAQRRLLLIGDVEEARRQREGLALEGMPPMLQAVGELVAADLAIRAVQASAAERALASARDAAARASIPALAAEIDAAIARLGQPAARLVQRGRARMASLREIEALLHTDTFIVDACRRRVVWRGEACPLTRRPILFALAAVLARAWPDDVPRDVLLREALEGEIGNASWRVRLRVEIGRLRKALGALASITATAHGFVLVPNAQDVALFLPPVDGEHAAVLALLGDGAGWSTSALALALGVSQRSVQRALAALHDAGRVRAFGRGRAKRWLSPPAAETATALLLPGVGLAG
jgi:hypothetical protein